MVAPRLTRAAVPAPVPAAPAVTAPMLSSDGANLAAVFATLRRLPLPRRVAASLEAESGLNDAPVILLVIALIVIVLNLLRGRKL